jgi:hypothetical protein
MPPLTKPRVLLPFGQLKRAVLVVDRGAHFGRVIPVRILQALDQPELARDAHLCFGCAELVTPEDAQALAGFKARAVAYAASIVEDPGKQRLLYDNVMSLEDIVRFDAEVPPSSHEIWRAELIDRLQGGYNAIARARR